MLNRKKSGAGQATDNTTRSTRKPTVSAKKKAASKKKAAAKKKAVSKKKPSAKKTAATATATHDVHPVTQPETANEPTVEEYVEFGSASFTICTKVAHKKQTAMYESLDVEIFASQTFDDADILQIDQMHELLSEQVRAEFWRVFSDTYGEITGAVQVVPTRPTVAGPNPAEAPVELYQQDYQAEAEQAHYDQQVPDEQVQQTTPAPVHTAAPPALTAPEGGDDAFG